MQQIRFPRIYHYDSLWYTRYRTGTGPW